MTGVKQQEVIEWAIKKLESYENEKKLYNLSAIILSILDVLCGIMALFYAGMMATSIVASILCGSVWGARFIQLVKTERLAKALKLLTVQSIGYLAVRKKRGEFMKDIKIKNWIVAILDIAAIIVGIGLVFIEPNIITNNIEMVITGLGAMLGVNVVIPCFNNAKVSEEEKNKAEANKELKLAKKEAEAIIKKEQEAQIEAKTAEILAAQAKAKENVVVAENNIVKVEEVNEVPANATVVESVEIVNN